MISDRIEKKFAELALRFLKKDPGLNERIELFRKVCSPFDDVTRVFYVMDSILTNEGPQEKITKSSIESSSEELIDLC